HLLSSLISGFSLLLSHIFLPCFKQKRRRRRAFEPPPADHLSTSPSLSSSSSPSHSAKGERGKTHPLDQSTAMAAAPGATPSPSALPLPCDQVAGDKTHNTQLKRLNPTTGLAKTREASSPAKDRRRADRRRFEQRERTSPKEEWRYSGEETTGAVKVTDGHAISDTTKQVTFLEG
ncbi:hypothetical protein LINPERHAP1_LOCUS29067, partial [Linum perenne]